MYDKDFVRWCLPIFKQHSEEEGVELVLKTLETQLAMPDDQFAYVASSLRAAPNVGKGLKKVNLAFSEMHLAELSLFSIKFQSQLFDLRSKLSMLNDEIDTAQKYHFMTFDSSLSPENHAIITIEVNNKYVFIQGMIVRALNTISMILNFEKY